MTLGAVGALIALMNLTEGAVTLPWGKGETLGEKRALNQTHVCTDGKGHYIVSAPHERQLTSLFTGDGKVLSQVNSPPPLLDGSSFFEPRYFNPTANDNFRGLDMRNYGSVNVDVEKKSCELSCGQRSTALILVEPAEAKALVLSAKFEPNPQHFVPHTLLRDTKGHYYLVERSVLPGEEKNFRLWVGPKGSMQQEKMMNSVTDSEGQIFSTKQGELRLLLDRVKPSFWIEGKRKTELRAVPVEENWGLIYNELGVYRGVRLGTPCDDM